MLHPLFKTLVTEPHRLVEHASAYAALAGAEAREVLGHWRLQALVAVGAAVALLLAVALAGGAALVLAALRWDELARPWLLVITPLVPALVAAACIVWLRASAAQKPFGLLREQWALDRSLLQTDEETL